MKLIVNGQERTVKDNAEIPLLWVLRDELQLTGTKFGCGLGFCGACTVHVDGQATRSCITPLAAVEGKVIRTIEGLVEDDFTRVMAESRKEAWAAVSQLPVD